MRIFTNVQTSVVAGITRVMSSFGEYVQTSHTPGEVELVCASLAGTPTDAPEWLTVKEPGENITHLTYTGPIPLFRTLLEESSTLDDLRFGFAGLTDAFRTKLREEKPDLVLVNGTYFVPWCLMMAARALRLPVLLYYHGSLTKETAHWHDEHARRLLWGMEASFDRADMRYIFPSDLVKRMVERDIFERRLYHKRAAVLPNPIPEEFFAARSRYGRNKVAFVGRWTRIKNTAFVAKFAHLNAKQRRPLDIHILTDERSRAHAARVMHNRVRWSTPRTRSADMAAFYTHMGAVLCPSHFETYGNVAQEAVAAGTAAFVSRNMGVAEVLERVGLQDLVVDFRSCRRIFDMVKNGDMPHITTAQRRALREEAGAHVVHEKLFEYLHA